MNTLKDQCIAEFFGTGLFLFFGNCCLCAVKLAGAEFGLWEICIVWGLGIALAVYLSAGISGAHLNPAVTVGLWLFANFEGRRVLPFCAAQIAGAFFGSAICYLLYHNLFVSYEAAHQMVRGSVDSLYLASIFSTSETILSRSSLHLFSQLRKIHWLLQEIKSTQQKMK